MENWKKNNFEMLKKYNIFVNESVDDIGRKVKIKYDSEYRYQAYLNGGDGTGIILQYSDIPYYSIDYNYKIAWNYEFSNIYYYRKEDFDFVDDDRKYIKNKEIDPYEEDFWGYED